MSKFFTLIADDDAAHVLLNMLNGSVLSGRTDTEVCECVKTVPPSMKSLNPKIAFDVIRSRSKNNLPIDFALIDASFDHEFGPETSDGADHIISELLKHHPFCRIIVVSKFAGTLDKNTFHSNGKAFPEIAKNAKTPAVNKKVDIEVMAWSKYWATTIAVKEKAKLLSSARDGIFTAPITFRETLWTATDLFPSQHQRNELSYKTIAEHFVTYPTVDTPNKWLYGVDNKFDEGIKYYYEELYFNAKYQAAIADRVNPVAEEILNSILEWYFKTSIPEFFQDCNEDFEDITDRTELQWAMKMESEIGIHGVVKELGTSLKKRNERGVFDEATMEGFMKRLIGRLVAVSLYLLLNFKRETIHSILQRGGVSKNFSDSKTYINQLIPTALYLSNLKNGHRSSKFSIIYKSLSADEQSFLRNWFDKTLTRFSETEVNGGRKMEIESLFESVKSSFKMIDRK